MKAVFITGGAQRLGRAMALGFARAGWDVALHYHCSDVAASSVQREIEGLGRQCVLLRADLTKTEELSELVRHGFAALPHLQVLINNASDFPAATLEQTDAALLARMTALHMHAPVLLSQAFAQHQPEARIIMMGDSNILRTNPGHFAYLLSKQGLMEATRMLARSLAPKARVNAICPGAILPEMNGDESKLAKRAATLPLAATASVEDIVNTALYLAAQGPITGQMLFVDGGEHLL